MKRFFLSVFLLCVSCILFAQTNQLQSEIDERTLPSPPKPKDRPSVALILSGGGAKGFAHLPILKMLEEENIPIDMIIGTSAGSIVGGLYSVGYSVDEIYDAMYRFSNTPVLSDAVASPFDKTLSEHKSISTPLEMNLYSEKNSSTLAGITTGQKIYDLIKSLTLKIPSDANYDDFEIPFRAVTVNLLDAKLEVKSSGDLTESIRASISMPAVFEPFKVDDKYYIDGGTLDNTPIDVAVKMGYDIIIVSELSQYLSYDSVAFEKSLISSLWQAYNLSQAHRAEKNYQFAEIIFFPEMGKASSFSYTKAKTIYDSSAKSIEKERENCKNIHNQIFKNNTDTKVIDTRNKYADKDFQVINNVKITNAHKEDVKFINSLFKKVKDKKFTDKDFKNISSSIYNIGKYSNIVTRITGEDGNKTVEVILNPITKHKITMGLGATYEGTFSGDSVSEFALCADLSAKGFTGFGSIFSLRTSVINGLYTEALLRQPIVSGLFFQGSVSYNNYDYIPRNGFEETSIIGITTKDFKGTASLGFQFANGKHLLFLGGGYNKVSGNVLSYTYNQSSSNVYGEYVINFLDSICLPSKGIYFSFKETALFPIEDSKNYPVIDLTDINFTGAIPLNDNWSIVLNATAGANFNRDLRELIATGYIYQFAISDRKYFPQLSLLENLSATKAMANLSLRYSPTSPLTVFGMKLFLFISGSIGSVWDDYKATPTNEQIYWCAAGNVALRITDTFGVLLRIGAGTSCNSVHPFFALDIGNLRF